MGFERILQPLQAAVFAFLDLDSRDAGPEFDNLGHIVKGDLDIGNAQLKRRQAFPLPGELGLDPGKFLIIDGGIGRIGVGVFQGMFLFLQVGDVVLQLEELGDFGVAQVAAGAGFVQQVNRLVRQVAVGDIPLRQLHHAGNNRVRHTDAVVLFIIPAHAAQHLDAVMDRRFFHLDWLEPAFQGGILFDKLAVFAEGGGADHLHLPAGKARVS